MGTSELAWRSHGVFLSACSTALIMRETSRVQRTMLEMRRFKKGHRYSQTIYIYKKKKENDEKLFKTMSLQIVNIKN